MTVLCRTTTLGAIAVQLALVWANPIGAQDQKSDSKEARVNLKEGDPAPAFECLDDEGKTWKSVDHVGKTYLVVYFYPGDFTPQCTQQARAFRDAMTALTAKGVEVVGVSGDTVATHQLFKKAQGLTFTLLADPEGAVAAKFGVPVAGSGRVKTKDESGQEIMLNRAVTASRWTFIIGKDGKVALKNTKVNPSQDGKQIAEFIDKIEKR